MIRSRPLNPVPRKTVHDDAPALPVGGRAQASAKYIKIVEWSEEDQSYIGYCPGLIGPCCHGDDEVEVFRSLCEIVDEWLETYRKDNRPLPSPTVGTEIGAYLHGATDSVRQGEQSTT